MISIGSRISIVDSDGGRSSGTTIYFDGKLVGLVQSINLEWNCSNEINVKRCSTLSAAKERDIELEEFATEMAVHGFWIEIEYLCLGMRAEYYRDFNGDIIREVKGGQTLIKDVLLQNVIGSS